MPAVQWRDGHIDRADTWRDLEKTIHYGSLFDGEDSPWTYRKSMRKRAEMWHLERINIYGSSRTFVLELVRVGMLTLIPDERGDT